MAINTWCISETELSTVGKILLIDVLEKFDEMLDMRMENFSDLGNRWLWTNNVDGVVKKYLCGPERSALLGLRDRLLGSDDARNASILEEELRAGPVCKACKHCQDADVVVAGWQRMEGSYLLVCTFPNMVSKRLLV
jgi:hypothetical protein